MVAVGCSYVQGIGLAQDDIFQEVFARRLRAAFSKSVVVWNLGLLGASNDYISRILYLAVPLLAPHIVLINFTRCARREYISIQNRYWNYNPSCEPTDEVARDIFRHFAALTSPYDNQLNFFKNYKAVEHLLTARSWLFSHINPAEFEPVANHMELHRFAGPLSFVDRARDGLHAGPQSHRTLADRYWDRFVENGTPEALGLL